MENCNNCPFNPKAKRRNEVQAKEMIFFNEGVPMTAKMKPVNDAFYEITEGKHKGDWVHTFNVKK